MPFLNPEEVIKEADLEAGLIVADFGCGAGFYSIPAATAVGSSGRVYALDIQKEMLEMVRSKGREKDLFNIETIVADLERPDGSKLNDEIVDRVFIANILFQTDDKENLIREAFRILKKAGKAIVVERDRIASRSELLRERLISKEKVKELFESNGFISGKEFHAGVHHYGLIFRKP